MEPAKEASTSRGDAASDIKPMFSDAQMRKLRFAVVAMGIVLLMGFGLVIGRIVYLLNRSPAASDQTAMVTATPPSSLPADIKLAIPNGAAVRQLSMSGNRLAVSYESPAGQGIVIVDLATGRPIQRIELTPAAR